MSTSLPRPKRAGEDFTRTHRQEDVDDSGASKKPRFDLRNPSTLAPDALEDDAVLDADEIGRRGQQVRRKAVNLDGYESDSDNEGFDARSSKKARQNEAKQEADDDDMFAELQEDFGAEDIDGDAALRRNKKNVRFLRDDEIEGQVASSKSGRTLRVDLSQGGNEVNIDEDDESESDVAEEDRARVDSGMDEELGAGAKKKHAPLLDAFNMRAEQEEGRFDEQGNYIRKAADPDAIHDSWLEGVSKRDIRLAKEAAEKREAARKEKDRLNDSVLTSDALRTLISQLQRGETALDALARIGKGAPKKPKWQTKRNKSRKGDQDTEMAEEDPKEVMRKQAIEAVTGAADILMARGQAEIYDTERELLTRQYRQETGEEWVDPPQNTDTATGNTGPVMWEYRWSDARDGGVVHGPYDGPTMESWKGAGYFGEGVEFRKVGDTGGWDSNASFV
jgi:CD2 antigen cytoplasmic tail-binding protein 2